MQFSLPSVSQFFLDLIRFFFNFNAPREKAANRLLSIHKIFSVPKFTFSNVRQQKISTFFWVQTTKTGQHKVFAEATEKLW